MTKVNVNKIKIKSSIKKEIIKDVIKKKVIRKKENKINYSDFIIKLRNKFSRNPYRFNGKIVVDEKIKYEDFVKIVISRNLNYFPVKFWKHLINNVEQYDNTYPLFWACEHACLNEVRMLIKNGSKFKPEYDGEIRYDCDVKKDCFEIVLSMISGDSYYDKVCYKKFRNKPLNDYEKKLFNDFNNYKLILEELMNNYTTILGNDYFDYVKFQEIIISNNLEIIKYFLQKVDLYPVYLKMLLFELFNNIIKLLAKEIIEIKGLEKDILCFKEFKRIKLIYIVKLVSKFFNKCGIENYDIVNKKVETFFGTFKISNFRCTKLFSEKLNYFRSSESNYIEIFFDNDKDWYNDMSKLFDNLIEKYEKELEEFLK